MTRVLAALALAALCCAPHPPLRAEEGASPSHEEERRQSFQGAVDAMVKGPAKLPIAGQATLELPEGFAWIPQAPASRLMKSLGNQVDAGFQGLVVPRTADRSFHFYDVSWSPAGFVKDDDARDWKADSLLSDMREGTEAGNARRRELGIPEIAITGWIEPPGYDARTHKLVWSVGLRDKASTDPAAAGLNYRTLVLGREGFVSMVLVTDPAHVDELRPATAQLLAALSFDEGKRYADFHAGTDRVAEFGLAALVAGVAAKKLGLLALAAAFFLKFAKIIAIGAAAALVAARRWLPWGRRRQSPPPVPTEGGGNSVLSGDAVPGDTAAKKGDPQ